MHTISLTTLFLFLGGLLALLAWVGWRFFFAGPRSSPGVFHSLWNRLRKPPASKSLQPRQTPEEACRISSAGSCAVELLDSEPPPTFSFSPRQLVYGVAPLLLVGTVVGMVLLLGKNRKVAPLEVRTLGQEEAARARLSQENLLPPPPLPPAIFISADYPHLETADRDWNKLAPGFMQQILLLFERMKRRGYPVALLEGYRSPERQDKLAGLGSHVTLVRGLQGKHCHGLAVDLAPMRDGHLVISEKDPWAFQVYQALGEEASALGLRWGGKWTLHDYGHVESALPLPRQKSAWGLDTNLPSKPSMALTAPAQAKARFCLSWRALACPVRRPWRTIPIRNTLRLKANRYELPMAPPLRPLCQLAFFTTTAVQANSGLNIVFRKDHVPLA